MCLPSCWNYMLKSAMEALCCFILGFLGVLAHASELQLTHEDKHKHLPPKGTKHKSSSGSGLVMRAAKPPWSRNAESDSSLIMFLIQRTTSEALTLRQPSIVTYILSEIS